MRRPQKSNHIYIYIYIGLISAICLNPYLFCLKVCLVPFVALESLNFGANLQLEPSEKSTKSDQGCTAGCQNRSKGVPRTGSEKQVAKKTRYWMKGPCKWLRNGSQNLKVWRIGNNAFRCFGAFFFDVSWTDWSTILKSFFSIIFMVLLNVFENRFEINWFV